MSQNNLKNHGNVVSQYKNEEFSVFVDMYGISEDTISIDFVINHSCIYTRVNGTIVDKISF